MELVQCAVRGKVHNQERQAARDAKVQHAYDMRVDQVGERTGFREEQLQLIAHQLRMQDLDSRLCFEIDVFAQIDRGELPTPQEPEQPVTAQESIRSAATGE